MTKIQYKISSTKKKLFTVIASIMAPVAAIFFVNGSSSDDDYSVSTKDMTVYSMINLARADTPPDGDDDDDDSSCM